MKGRLVLFVFILLNLRVFGDVAMSGVWWSGGTGSYALLYPEDSIALNKIQMKKELVSIQLYKGYAVVKGEYWMYNTTKDALTIKTGYPLQEYSQYSHDVNESGILFDSLSRLQVFVDSLPATIIAKPHPYYDDVASDSSQYHNWYIWVTKFKPMGYTKIDVYFILNTNHTSISRGYGRASYNGFIYILQSGATWKQPIEQGTILVQLMDGMTISDVHGVQPANIFSANAEHQLLKYVFSNLSPTKENNIIMTYSDDAPNFDFAKIVNNTPSYFQAIDKLSKTNIEQLPFKPATFKDPLDISEGVNPFAIALVLMIGGVLLVVALIIIAIVVVVKIVKKRRK